MSLDAGPLGVETAELMEELERTYGDAAQLRVAVAVVEVRYIDADGDKASTVHIAGLGKGSRSRVVGALFRAMGMAAFDEVGRDAD